MLGKLPLVLSPNPSNVPQVAPVNASFATAVVVGECGSSDTSASVCVSLSTGGRSGVGVVVGLNLHDDAAMGEEGLIMCG